MLCVCQHLSVVKLMCERLRNLSPSCDASNFNNELKTVCRKAIYIWSVANVQRTKWDLWQIFQVSDTCLAVSSALCSTSAPQLSEAYEEQIETCHSIVLSRLLGFPDCFDDEVHRIWRHLLDAFLNHLGNFAVKWALRPHTLSKSHIGPIQ